MFKSEYLEKFIAAKEHFRLAGNKILIERLDLGEVKTSGGIIISESANLRQDLKLQKPHVGVVLVTGPGYYDSATGKYDPLDLEPGNIIIYNALGAQYYSVLPGVANFSNNKVGLSSDADVQIVFKDMEAFSEYAKIFGV